MPVESGRHVHTAPLGCQVESDERRDRGVLELKRPVREWLYLIGVSYEHRPLVMARDTKPHYFDSFIEDGGLHDRL